MTACSSYTYALTCVVNIQHTEVLLGEHPLIKALVQKFGPVFGRSILPLSGSLVGLVYVLMC